MSLESDQTPDLVRLIDIANVLPINDIVRLVIGSHTTNYMEAKAIPVSMYAYKTVYKIESMVENVGLSRNCVVHYIHINN